MNEGVCRHLAELDRALRRGGYEDLGETNEGWGLGEARWVYFHCTFELPRVAQRFEMPPFVEIYRQIDAHYGAWLGYECKRCDAAVLGRHPSRSENAPNFPGTGARPRPQYERKRPPNPIAPRVHAPGASSTCEPPPFATAKMDSTFSELISADRVAMDRRRINRRRWFGMVGWSLLTASGFALAAATGVGESADRITLGVLVALGGGWLFWVSWKHTRLARYLLEEVEPELGSVRLEETPGPHGDGVQWVAQIHLDAVRTVTGRRAVSPWSAVVIPLEGTLEGPLGQTRRARIYLHPDEAVPLMLAVKEGLLLVRPGSR